MPLNENVIIVSEATRPMCATSEARRAIAVLSISVLDPDGTLLGRYGDPEEGEEPGRFIAPHGIAVDSRGDVYVGEVSYTIRGSHLDPPRELRSLKKMRNIG
jgi:hypothetical protein